MAIIDIHAHIYPDKVAQRASERRSGNSPASQCGTTPDRCKDTSTLLHRPLSHSLVHSVAVKAKVVESINNFVAATCAEHANFIGFATMHPGLREPRG